MMTRSDDIEQSSNNFGQCSKMIEDCSNRSAHVLEMKQEQAVTPQRETAPQQEQSLDIGLGL
jgi:hypothetical protein